MGKVSESAKSSFMWQIIIGTRVTYLWNCKGQSQPIWKWHWSPNNEQINEMTMDQMINKSTKRTLDDIGHQMIDKSTTMTLDDIGHQMINKSTKMTLDDIGQWSTNQRKGHWMTSVTKWLTNQRKGHWITSVTKWLTNQQKGHWMTLVTKCRSPLAREPAKHQPHPSHSSSSDFKLKRRKVFCSDALTSWLETAYSSIKFVQRKNAFSSSNSQPLSCCRCVTKDAVSPAAGETDDKDWQHFLSGKKPSPAKALSPPVCFCSWLKMRPQSSSFLSCTQCHRNLWTQPNLGERKEGILSTESHVTTSHIFTEYVNLNGGKKHRNFEPSKTKAIQINNLTKNISQNSNFCRISPWSKIKFVQTQV